ncbi:hypothetical protein [Fontivita pretiosa]|uniref:hypothetical protein n=1 Tax=Fontivita pretiosa TaxID=2989684 RepID=UPI003D16F836
MSSFEMLEPRRLLAVAGVPLKLGAAGLDMGQRIAHTPDGGFVLAGLFAGTVDFDPGAGRTLRSSRGDTDIFVARFSSAGELQWVDQFGDEQWKDAINDQDVIDIAADPRRAGGQFINGVSADPRAAAEYINDLGIAPDGTIVLAGSFIGSVDFDPGPAQRVFATSDDEFHDAFVIKLAANDGSLLWAQRFGDRFSDTASSLAIDSSGNIIVGGLFTRTVNFAPDHRRFVRTAVGRADGYVMKLAADGTVQWVNSVGGDAVGRAERDAVNDVAVDAAGSVYAVGSFVGDDVDFNPAASLRTVLTSVDKTDGFLAKYSAAGRLLYAGSVGGEGYDALTHVVVDSDRSVLVAGYFQGEDFDADPGPRRRVLAATPERAGDDPRFTDLFVQKIAAGRTVWLQQLAGTGTEFISDMKLDSANDLILAGSFYGRARFGASRPLGPLVSSVRGLSDFDDNNDSDRRHSYDAFIWKLSNAGSPQWVRTLGIDADDFASGLSVAPDQSILATGRFRGLVDFDTTAGGVRRLRGLGVSDAFVTQLDPTGLPLL